MKIQIKKTRSLLGAGYSKLVVLPKVWIDHHQLNKKSKVSFEIDEFGKLIVSPTSKENESTD